MNKMSLMLKKIDIHFRKFLNKGIQIFWTCTQTPAQLGLKF